MTQVITFQSIHVHPACLIAKQSNQYAWSQVVFDDCLRAGYPGWVIVDSSDRVLGYILVAEQVDACELLNIAVDQRYLRQGYATQLIETAMHYAKQQGFQRFHLEVRQSNQPAINLYQRLGFQRVGMRRGYYPSEHGREDAELYAMEW